MFVHAARLSITLSPVPARSSSYDNPWAGARGPAPFDQRFFLIMNLAVGGTGLRLRTLLHSLPSLDFSCPLLARV